MYIASFFTFGGLLWSEIGACCNLVVHVSENKNDQLNISLDLDLPLDLFPVVDYIYAQIWSLYFRHVSERERVQDDVMISTFICV